MEEIELEQEFDVNSIEFQSGERVHHVPLDSVIEKLTADGEDINCAEQSQSDVVPGVYEGGAKVWECTQDLGNFMTKPNEGGQSLLDSLAAKNVLDLGCGAGILGILAMRKANVVHFQDYVRGSQTRVSKNVNLSTLLLE